MKRQEVGAPVEMSYYTIQGGCSSHLQLDNYVPIRGDMSLSNAVHISWYPLNTC